MVVVAVSLGGGGGGGGGTPLTLTGVVVVVLLAATVNIVLLGSLDEELLLKPVDDKICCFRMYSLRARSSGSSAGDLGRGYLISKCLNENLNIKI